MVGPAKKKLQQIKIFGRKLKGEQNGEKTKGKFQLFDRQRIEQCVWSLAESGRISIIIAAQREMTF